MNLCVSLDVYFSLKYFHINHKNINNLNENLFFSKKWKVRITFLFCGSSLNDISLYLKQKKAWIHRRKVLDSLCSRSCIVPFRREILADLDGRGDFVAVSSIPYCLCIWLILLFIIPKEYLWTLFLRLLHKGSKNDRIRPHFILKNILDEQYIYIIINHGITSLNNELQNIYFNLIRE